MHEEKFLELILCKLQSAVLNVFSFIEFSFSQKVVFSYFLWYMAYLSSWKLGVDIIAGISTLLIFYLREIQKNHQIFQKF